MTKIRLEEKIKEYVKKYICLNKPFEWLRYSMNLYYKREYRTETKFNEIVNFCLDEYNRYVKEGVFEKRAKEISLTNTTLYYSKKSMIDQV